MQAQRNLKSDVPFELRPLVGGFLNRRMQDIVDLERSLGDGDLPAISAIAHRLKGNGVGYGFPVISEIGRELEVAAKSGRTDQALLLIHELRDVVHYFQHEKLS